MGAVIYHSNKLEVLYRKLSDTLNRSQGVLQTEYIVTQTAGMESWLKTELARKNGVFANYRFLKQDHLLEALYTELTGKPAYAVGLRPAIYALLGGEEFRTLFPGIAEYYYGDHVLNGRLKQIQLAGKTADLFDQYQVYRTSMMLGWEEEPLGTCSGHEGWQQWLWLALRKKFPWHVPKYTMQAQLMSLLEQPAYREKAQKLFPRVSFFGISIFTDFHTAVLNRLAEATDLHYYLMLPNAELLGRKVFENPILSALGKNYVHLVNMLPQPAALVELQEEPQEHSGTQHTSGASLVKKLRNSLYRDKTESPGSLTEEDLTDGTLVINSAYTPVREVEVFYNYLVDLMESGARLEPGQVLVLIPDLETYKPYIRAVFDNAPYPIPFYISGDQHRLDDTVMHTLGKLLAFDALDHFPAEEVVALLEERRVREKYRIEDLAYIRHTIDQANIRFGLENKMEDQTQYVSWQYGLEKIIMGFAVLSDQSMSSSGKDTAFYPWTESETSVAYDLFRLKAFIDDLAFFSEQKEQPKSFALWKTFLLEEVLERSVAFSYQDQEELNEVYKHLNSMEVAYADELLPFEVFRQLVEERFLMDPVSGEHISGSVTFMPVIPGRGIPKRVIALMGMNREVFPRKDSSLGFDLMQNDPLIGDRSKKENDKMAFLECLLAAREYLYISYIGCDAKNNEELPPSIVVDELLDYLEYMAPAQGYKQVREKICATHPLHGFSSRYTIEDRRLFTYLFPPTQTAAESSLPQVAESLPLQPAVHGLEPESHRLDDFCRFFTHPIEWFYKQVLGIRYDSPEPPLLDNEVFDMDFFQYWALKDFLVRIGVEGEVLENPEVALWKDKGIKGGILPLAGMADLQLRQASKETELLRSAWAKLTKGKVQESRSVDFSGDGIHLIGKIEDIYDGTFCCFNTAGNLMKQQVRAIIKHLVICAQGFTGNLVLLDSGGSAFSCPAVESEEAGEKLEKLVALFQLGNTQRLPIVLQAVRVYAAEKDSAKKREVYNSEIRKQANGDPNSGRPPDRYVALALGEGVFEEVPEEMITQFYELILEPWNT